MNIVIDEKYAGVRLDKVLVELFPAFSRTFLQKCIKQGQVLVNGVVVRPRDLVNDGDSVDVDFDVNCNNFNGTRFDDALVGENIPLSVLHDDSELLVIDKPVGMVVHPGAGHPRGTLVNALLYYCSSLKFLPRAGIIHRLDKDTGGILVVAKTRTAHKFLIDQMQSRTVHREYLCLVHGVVISGGCINAPIGRHPRDRKRMAVVGSGREAVTHYRVLKRFIHHTLLSVRLETGRTHQIRVHMAYIRHPVVGDMTYGAHRCTSLSVGTSVFRVLQGFKHQALHACRLKLIHPKSGEHCEWTSDVPQDMRVLLDLLSAHAEEPS